MSAVLERETDPEPDAAHARFLEVRTFASLDGFRALAILAVLWHHTIGLLPDWPITGRGFLGVDLFFVISGFLIVTLLLREKQQTGSISLRKFYIRRFLRIFPPYYLMLLVVGVTAFVKPGNTSLAIRHDLPFAAFYISNFVQMQSMLAITWSLAVEEQFYLIAPAIEKYLRQGMAVALAATYVLVSLPPFWVFPEIDLPSFFRQTTFGPILLGVALAHLLHDPVGYAWMWRWLQWRFAPLLALALVFLAASYTGDDISGWPRIVIHWSFVVLIASCVVREHHVMRPMLSCWPMRRIGIVSYGIYLYHLVVLHFSAILFTALGVSAGSWSFVAEVLCTWAVAEFSYRYYEQVFLRMKARYEVR